MQELYKIDEVIGLGSFGEIRKIENYDSGEIFVVKMMSKRLMQKELIKRC